MEPNITQPLNAAQAKGHLNSEWIYEGIDFPK